MRSGMISTRSGYLATKLIAIAEAFRSQSAWSWRKAGKFAITVLIHSGRVAPASSSVNFMGPRMVWRRTVWQRQMNWAGRRRHERGREQVQKLNFGRQMPNLGIG